MPDDEKPIFPTSELQSEHPRTLGRPSRSINDDEYREAARLQPQHAVDDEHPSTEPGAPVPVMKDNAVPPRDLPALADMHRKLGQGAEPLETHEIGEIKPTRSKPVESPSSSAAAAEAQHSEVA